MYEWMWRSEDNLSCHCEESHLPHLRQGLSLVWSLPVRLGCWPVRQMFLLLECWDCKHPTFLHGFWELDLNLPIYKAHVLQTEPPWTFYLCLSYKEEPEGGLVKQPDEGRSCSLPVSVIPKSFLNCSFSFFEIHLFVFIRCIWEFVCVYTCASCVCIV